ncbi:hypothetical protein CTEN210_18343 [Chaetoceros tenuissimus]|uniref:Leucine-rich repeat domain-containing protein n=1 Tax=Chaetoceros tenuissimus TaxID=426638 RepID=A0AAD3DDB0_9STRA|nr:hypothetical protein CTEN210_18343 [Chaetoceros tenuissimus]
MYKGKKTLFFNGEIFWGDEEEFLIYDYEERNSWQVIIVLPGVEVIPEFAFRYCENLKTVIMADTVKRIEFFAFGTCTSLVFISLSRNLEFIGVAAFSNCVSLTSIFIPPSCRWIGDYTFEGCGKLIILHVPQDTQLGFKLIEKTALIRRSLFKRYTNDLGLYEINEINDLIKNINGDTDEYALHRACSSYNPSTDLIYDLVKRQGLKALNKKNEIGITPLDYLDANPFADNIDHRGLMKRYILEMMGEAV